jgi:hypothetical protein
MSRPGIEPDPGLPVGSEHSGKEPSRQLICWLFGTTSWAEAGAARGLYNVKKILTARLCKQNQRRQARIRTRYGNKYTVP